MAERPGGGGGRRGGSGRSGRGRGGGKPGAGKPRDGGRGRTPGKARGAGKRRKPAAKPRPPRPEVAIFAKAPIPGNVKTRLTPALGADEAADLYRALLMDTIEVAESADARLTVAFTPATSRRHLERLLGPRRRLLTQPPGDLGERIEAVVEQIQRGKPRRVLVVGSDCPGLTDVRIGEAWSALESTPVVLGPATDGGFYLIGFARPATGLLREIPWSSGSELEAVRERLAERAIAVRELAPERDLDTPHDLVEWYAAARQAGLESSYPRTWKTLHSLMTPRRFAEIEARLRESRPLS